MGLKRKIFDKLLKWKNNTNKVAILIKGARQVGKTYIVRELGKHYKNFVEINFERNIKAKEAFEGDLTADAIISKLSLMGFVNFSEPNTLIFFDEIQVCPKARTAIKFLVEDGRFDYISSGSLLGLNYKEVSSYPVGYEDQLEMYPLDFEEFLWSKNIDPKIIENLYDSYLNEHPIDDFIHNMLFKYFKDYMYVGGMPAVVEMFNRQPDFGETLKIQKRIMDSYRDDISKYAGSDRTLAKAMFDAIPYQLNKQHKRFTFSDLKEHSTENKFRSALEWLIDAGIAYPSYNVSELDLPLVLKEKRSLYKVYLLDSGLLSSCFDKGIQFEIYNSNLKINEGSITENIVADQLIQNGLKLHYYDKKSRQELDFIYPDKNKISVIEVKSGSTYKRHISLTHASNNYSDCIGRKIVLCRGNIEKVNDIVYMPLYMSMFIGLNANKKINT